MIDIKLDIPKDITHLAGFSLGLDICRKQITPILKGEIKITIEIPEQIEGVAVGFVKGLREGIENYNKDIEISFKAKSMKLEDKLIKDYNY